MVLVLSLGAINHLSVGMRDKTDEKAGQSYEYFPS